MFRGLEVEKVDIGPGSVFDIPAMIPHLFCVYESGELFEEYYPEGGQTVKNNDIIRICQGGWMKTDLLNNLPKGLPIHPD